MLQMYWEEFQKKVIWDNNKYNNNQMYIAFKKRLQNRYSDYLSDIRKKRIRPPFVSEQTWRAWLVEWDSAAFKKLCMQNQLNRYGGDNTQPAAATHTRGSISHSEILERLTTLLGRVPTSHELFAYTHTKRHDGSSWSDPRAQAVEEEYVRAVAASLQSEENRAEDVLEMYYQVVGGRNKKHRLYGLGDAACRYYGSASSQCPPNTSGASTSASPDPYSHMQSQFDRSNQIVQTLVDSQERHDEGMQRGHESRQIHLGVTCEDIEEIKKNQHDLEVQMRDQIGSLQDVIARFRLELTELRQNREQHSSSQVDSINDDDLDDLT